MKPLALLLIVFVLGCTTAKITISDWNLIVNGNLAMCLMLCFTAIGHFKFADGMAMMLPSYVPLRKQLVLLTGILEIILGIALLITRYRELAGILLIVFLVLVLPANISAAIRHIDYEKATTTGKGPGYLWFRVPMQFFLIAWVWYFSVRG